MGRAGVDSAVVTVGAGREDGASSEVDCCRMRALFVPSLVLPLGTHPFVIFEDGGLGARRCGSGRAAERADVGVGVGCCSPFRPDSGEGWLRARGKAGLVFRLLESLSERPCRFCV